MPNQYAKKVPAKIKKQIVSESLEPGCVVSQVASKYGVSKQSIYVWRREFFAHNPQRESSDPTRTNSSSSFVELPIIDSHSPVTKQHVLEKASLVFRDFSLVLEGKVQTSNLLSILKILEESC